MGKGRKKRAGRASAASLEQRGFNVGQLGLAAAQRLAASQNAAGSKRHGSRGKGRANKMGSRGVKGGGSGKKGRSASEDAIRKACRKGDLNAILSSQLLSQALRQECSEETAAMVLTLLVSHARLGEATRLLCDGVAVSLHNVVQALLSLPQLQRVETAVALEFVEAAVAGRSSFAVRQLSSVLLEFISEANGAVEQMQSQPLASLVRQGRAAVGRLSAGQKQGEVLYVAKTIRAQYRSRRKWRRRTQNSRTSSRFCESQFFRAVSTHTRSKSMRLPSEARGTGPNRPH